MAQILSADVERSRSDNFTGSGLEEGLSMAEAEDSRWVDRAERLLTDALGNIRSEDVIPTVVEALAALYLSVGETPCSVVVDATDCRGEDDLAVGCSCPAELVRRGGWQSRCRVHGH